MKMSANDRMELRKNYGKVVEVISNHWDEPVEYLCSNLSPRGTFLKTNFPLCQGETILVSFRLPGIKDEFNLFGEVSRVDMSRRRSEWGTCGMGIDFKGVASKERLLIRQGLRRTPPPLPFHLRLKAEKAV
jgi:hypothetical protein